MPDRLVIRLLSLPGDKKIAIDAAGIDELRLSSEDEEHLHAVAMELCLEAWGHGDHPGEVLLEVELPSGRQITLVLREAWT